MEQGGAGWRTAAVRLHAAAELSHNPVTVITPPCKVPSAEVREFMSFGEKSQRLTVRCHVGIFFILLNSQLLSAVRNLGQTTGRCTFYPSRTPPGFIRRSRGGGAVRKDSTLNQTVLI